MVRFEQAVLSSRSIISSYRTRLGRSRHRFTHHVDEHRLPRSRVGERRYLLEPPSGHGAARDGGEHLHARPHLRRACRGRRRRRASIRWRCGEHLFYQRSASFVALCSRRRVPRRSRSVGCDGGAADAKHESGIVTDLSSGTHTDTLQAHTITRRPQPSKAGAARPVRPTKSSGPDRPAERASEHG